MVGSHQSLRPGRMRHDWDIVRRGSCEPTSSSSTSLGFAPLDASGTQLLCRFVAAAYERRSLGIASHWPFEQWGRFIPEHTTAVSLLDRLLHQATVVATDGESFRMREALARGGGRLSVS